MSWPVDEDPENDVPPTPLPLPPVPQPMPQIKRPDHWPKCERVESCEGKAMTSYFNELACQCFTN